MWCLLPGTFCGKSCRAGGGGGGGDGGASISGCALGLVDELNQARTEEGVKLGEGVGREITRVVSLLHP